MNEIERAIKDFENFKQAGYTHCELPSSWHIELAISALRAQPDHIGEITEMILPKEESYQNVNDASNEPLTLERSDSYGSKTE